MYVVAILAAAGRGTRLGGAVPKPLLAIGGRSILQRSFEALDQHDRVQEIVVAVSAELAAAPPAYLRTARKPVQVVAGGVRRQDSVANAFDRVPARADIVVVHDAARPFASGALISRVIDAAGESGAAVAAVRVSDTVKESAAAAGQGDERAPLVGRTLPRDRIFLAQTPQAFKHHVLAAAIALGRKGLDATDEAALAESAGYPVQLVEGEARNVKITTLEDVHVAQRLVQDEAREGGTLRIGTGYDLHRLVEGRALVLGGVAIPHQTGLLGHSDADVLSHAITDAILGAASLGDIGRHFPDTDARWAGASSLDLLRTAVDLVRQAGFIVVNVDAVVMAERPKLAPHEEQIRASLAQTLGIDVSRISVKGKTNEGIGEIGRGEAIAVHAVALLSRRSTVVGQESESAGG